MEIHEDDELSLLQRIESSPYRPSESECTYLRNQLEVANNLLRKLDEEDIAIQNTSRSCTIRHIGRCRGALTPYSKLPMELIEEIIRCKSPSTEESYPLSGLEIGLRLQITQICRSWRLVAFSIPTLWDMRLEELPTRGIVSLIAAWFRQCSNMEIWLGSKGRLDWLNYPSLEHFSKEVLIPYSHRIGTLSMLPLDISHPHSLCLDRLKCLQYSCRNPWTMSTEPIVAPSLRSLSISFIEKRNHCWLLRDLPPLPWGQLTSIAMQGMVGFYDIHDILRQCTCLELCCIESLYYDSPDIPQDTVLDLPRLKELRIDFHDFSLFHKLFAFNAPNLASLAVGHLPDTPEIFDHFKKYLKRTRRTLRSFEVMTGLASMDDIMRAMPFVVEFTCKCDIPPSTLTKVGTGELLQDVEVLHLTDSFNSEMIVDCLVPGERRRESRLRDIHIYSYLNDRSSYRKEELCALGINIHWVDM